MSAEEAGLLFPGCPRGGNVRFSDVHFARRGYPEEVLLAFLAFVVLLAGFVAYSADTIARRAGRRHLRLFGLRPKTTALVVAVLAGMGISLASMLAFFALNRQAIRNIEQADQLRKELNGLKVDVKRVQSDLKTAQTDRDTANVRADQARRASLSASVELDKAQTDLQTAVGATHGQEARARSLLTQTRQLQFKVGTLSTLKASLEAQALKNQQALTTSRSGLQQSQTALSLARSRASGLDLRLTGVQREIAVLDRKNVQAQADTAAAQDRVTMLQGQISQLTLARKTVTQQRDFAAQQRDQLTREQVTVTQQRDAAAQDRDRVVGQLQDLQTQLAQARTQSVQATLKATQATLKAAQVQSQLTSLNAQRDTASQDLKALKATVSGLQNMVAGLQNEGLKLKTDNDTLRLSLTSSQASVKHLEDEYSRANTELSASRNGELSYAKNSIVYEAVVPSVRNLDAYLQAAGVAAAARGARGNPAVRLAPSSRQALETTLRGLNASTYVLCRASGNVAAGFAVDLSCDAKANTLIYQRGSVIRKASINLQGGDEALRGQLQELIGDAVVDLIRRGVPPENVLNGGLNSASLYNIVSRLAAKGGSSAVVGVMSRQDVKPSSQVDLYADIVQ